MDKLEFLKTLYGLDIADGNLTDDDAIALIKVAQMVARPKCNFLDIGPWKGKSTICLAIVAAKENGIVWTVDHFQGSAGTKEIEQAKYTDILQIFKRNLEAVNAWDLVIPLVTSFQNITKLLPQNFFNLIYIDADNSYTTMKYFLQHAWPKVKPRGIICGRNLLYDYPDRKTFVDEEIDKAYSTKYQLHPGIIKSVYEMFKGDYKRMPNSTVWYKKKEG